MQRGGQRVKLVRRLNIANVLSATFFFMLYALLSYVGKIDSDVIGV